MRLDNPHPVRKTSEAQSAPYVIPSRLTGDHCLVFPDLRRECDELRLEVALGCPLDEFRRREGLVEPEPGGPTDAELRRKAAELGLPVPPARRPADPDWHRRYLLAPIPETREAA